MLHFHQKLKAYISFVCFVHIHSLAGGSYRNWKKRYFVLSGNSLEYYKNEGDASPKGIIDLTAGRGVRDREQCDLEWPDKARLGRSFGVAVEARTFYLYGEDRAAIQYVNFGALLFLHTQSLCIYMHGGMLHIQDSFCLVSLKSIPLSGLYCDCTY